MKRLTIFFFTHVLIISPIFLNAQCNGQYSGGAYAITQTTASIALYDSVGGINTYYVEVGLPGFTPGTNAIAGVGGTVYLVPSTQTFVNVAGLSAATTYNFVVRKMCSPGVWSSNTPVKSFFTAFNCANAIPINCGVLNTNNFSAGSGAWYSGCSCGDGREIIYSFTPVVSGIHVLFLSANPMQVCYAFKPASGGCSISGFNCIGYNYNTIINQLSFGPLTAGIQYYIMADPSSTGPVNTTFRVECPNCAQPSNVVLNNITAEGFTANFNGLSGYAEFGPLGFVPGSGGSPGVNGTVKLVSNGSVITGMAGNSFYDVFIRSYCGNNYSPNSIKQSIQTLPCPTTTNYGTLGNSIDFLNYGNTYNLGVYGNSPLGCSPASGEEQIVKFTPPSAGYYDVFLSYGLWSGVFPPVPSYLHVALRQADGSCSLNNYLCQIPSTTVFGSDNYIMNMPSSGTVYDILLDAVDSFASGQVSITINCGKPANLLATNITSNSATVSFSCNCPNPTYLEYGPAGFTPGAGSAAGGGVVLQNVTSPVSLSGLTIFQNYDVYLRTSCAGYFSENAKVSFKTLHSCGTEPFITCGNNFSVNLFVNGGQWSTYNCGALSATSTEYIYRFTASQTGNYIINNISSIGYGSTPLNVYYKTVGGSCDATGWTCGGTLTSAPQSLSFGPLTANTTYVLLFDGTYANNFKTLNISCVNCPATITASGNTTFCQGGNINLKADTGAGISYQWYKNQAIIVGATANKYNVTTSGFYYVVETRSCGTAISNAIIVAVNSLPIVAITTTGATTFCTGDSVKLSTTIFSGESVQWKKNGVNIVGATGADFYARQSGVYKVKKTNANGCFAVSSDVTVTVNALPAASVTPQGPTTFCAGDSVKLTGNSAVGISYLWKRNNVAIAGATKRNYYAKTAGYYKLKVTNSFGCTKLSSSVLVTIPCRLNEQPYGFTDFDATVFPNPSDDIFNLKITGNNNEPVTVKITDVLGQLIVDKITSLDNNNYQIENLSPGMYSIDVISGNYRKMIKIIKVAE